jgi:hypothetical protein
MASSTIVLFLCLLTLCYSLVNSSVVIDYSFTANSVTFLSSQQLSIQLLAKNPSFFVRVRNDNSIHYSADIVYASKVISFDNLLLNNTENIVTVPIIQAESTFVLRLTSNSITKSFSFATGRLDDTIQLAISSTGSVYADATGLQALYSFSFESYYSPNLFWSSGVQNVHRIANISSNANTIQIVYTFDVQSITYFTNGLVAVNRWNFYENPKVQAPWIIGIAALQSQPLLLQFPGYISNYVYSNARKDLYTGDVVQVYGAFAENLAPTSSYTVTCQYYTTGNENQMYSAEPINTLSNSQINCRLPSLPSPAFAEGQRVYWSLLYYPTELLGKSQKLLYFDSFDCLMDYCRESFYYYPNRGQIDFSYNFGSDSLEFLQNSQAISNSQLKISLKATNPSFIVLLRNDFGVDFTANILYHAETYNFVDIITAGTSNYLSLALFQFQSPFTLNLANFTGASNGNQQFSYDFSAATLDETVEIIINSAGVAYLGSVASVQQYSLVFTSPYSSSDKFWSTELADIKRVYSNNSVDFDTVQLLYSISADRIPQFSNILVGINQWNSWDNVAIANPLTIYPTGVASQPILVQFGGYISDCSYSAGNHEAFPNNSISVTGQFNDFSANTASYHLQCVYSAGNVNNTIVSASSTSSIGTVCTVPKLAVAAGTKIELSLMYSDYEIAKNFTHFIAEYKVHNLNSDGQFVYSPRGSAPNNDDDSSIHPILTPIIIVVSFVLVSIVVYCCYRQYKKNRLAHRSQAINGGPQTTAENLPYSRLL